MSPNCVDSSLSPSVASLALSIGLDSYKSFMWEYLTAVVDSFESDDVAWCHTLYTKVGLRMREYAGVDIVPVSVVLTPDPFATSITDALVFDIVDLVLISVAEQVNMRFGATGVFKLMSIVSDPEVINYIVLKNFFTIVPSGVWLCDFLGARTDISTRSFFEGVTVSDEWCDEIEEKRVQWLVTLRELNEPALRGVFQGPGPGAWPDDIEPTPPDTSGGMFGFLREISDTTKNANTTILDVHELVNKLTGIVDIFSTDRVRDSLEKFENTNSAISDMVTWLKGIVQSLKDPSTWLKYVLPALIGVFAYLVASEKRYHIVPLLEGLAIAGVTYYGLPALSGVVEWCSFFRETRFQGPLDKMNNVLSSILSSVYKCDVSFDRLSKILQNVPKNIEAIQRIVTMIQEFCTYVKIRIYRSLGWDITSGDLTIDNAVSRTRALVDELNSDDLVFTSNTKARVHDLVDAVEYMMVQCQKKRDSVGLTLLRDCMTQLRKVQVEVVRKTGQGFGDRNEPVMVVLYGASGQGKTTAMKHLEMALMKQICDETAYKAYLENSRNGVFGVAPGMKHWEGAANTVKIIKIDELFAEKETAGMETSQSLLIQQLVNTNEFTPLMAFEKKGSVSLQPDFVLATTNATSLSVVQTLNVPWAMRRRFHILAEVVLDGQADSKSIDIDLSRLRFKMSVIDDKNVFVQNGPVLTMPELFKDIMEHHELFRQKQRMTHEMADIHADYLIAGDPDPKAYLANLKKAGLEFKRKLESEEVKKKAVDEALEPLRIYEFFRLPSSKVCEFVQTLEPRNRLVFSANHHLLVTDMSEDQWLKFGPFDGENDPRKPVRFINNRSAAFDVYIKFLKFTEITGFGWSLNKFLQFFGREDYVELLAANIFAFVGYVQAFYTDVKYDVFGQHGLMKKCAAHLTNIYAQVKRFVNHGTNFLIYNIEKLAFGLGFFLLFFRVFIYIRYFFSSRVMAETQNGGYLKEKKAMNRDRRYATRMKAGEDVDWHEVFATRGDFQGPVHVPEFLMNVYQGVQPNIYQLTCPMFEDHMGYVLFLKNNIMLMPHHFWAALERAVAKIPAEEFHQVTFKQGPVSVSVPLSRLAKKCYVYTNNEYFIAEVDLGRQHKDITNHFCDGATMNKFLIDFRNNFNVAAFTSDMAWLTLPTTYHPTVELRDVGDYMVVHNVLRVQGIKTTFGDCGMLYYAVDGPAAGKVVGMHIGGGSLGGMGFAMLLNQRIVTNMERLLTGNVPIPRTRVVLLDDIHPPERISTSNAHMQFEGNERVVEYSKKNALITIDRMEKRLENYVDFELKATKEHLRDVCEVIGANYLSHLPRIPKRLDLHTAIFGEPGRINSIDFSTSAGYPLQGTDLDKRHWRTKDGEPNLKVLNKIRDMLNEAVALIMQGIWPNFIFKIFPKDELLSIEDVDEKGKVRTINGGPILFILLQKMYYGDLMSLIEANPLEFNTLVGADLNSMDGDDLVQRMLVIDPTGKNCFGGDISKFEFRQREEVSMAIFKHIIEPLYAHASPEEAQIRETLWRMSTRSVNLFRDKCYLVCGPRASGEYLTSGGNTIYVQVAVVYSYYKAMNFIRPLLPTFYQNVYYVSVGDDHVGAVSKTASEYFDQFAVEAGMADLGLIYTDPDKGAITQPFVDLDNIIMLQCKPRYDELLGRWVWYQKLQTVLEMAQWTKKTHKKPNMIIWASNVIDSLRKLCIHDEKTWNEYIPKYRRMIAGHNVDVPTWSYRAMQQIVLQESYMRFKFRADIDREEAEFQGRFESGRAVRDIFTLDYMKRHPVIAYMYRDSPDFVHLRPGLDPEVLAYVDSLPDRAAPVNYVNRALTIGAGSVIGLFFGLWLTQVLYGMPLLEVYFRSWEYGRSWRTVRLSADLLLDLSLWFKIMVFVVGLLLREIYNAHRN